MSGYARIDLRMGPDGHVYVLEANANPNLAYGEDFAESAETGGIPFEGLLHAHSQPGLDLPRAVEKYVSGLICGLEDRGSVTPNTIGYNRHVGTGRPRSEEGRQSHERYAHDRVDESSAI